MKGRGTRVGSEAGQAGGAVVGPTGAVRDPGLAEAGPEPPAGGAHIGAERPCRFFIVSVSEDAGGDLYGVVEAVRSGWKERFQGLAALGPVVGALYRRLRDDETGRAT